MTPERLQALLRKLEERVPTPEYLKFESGIGKAIAHSEQVRWVPQPKRRKKK